MENKTVALAYVPVLHQGYLAYFAELEKRGIATLYVVSDEVLCAHSELDYLNRKDRVRAVPHELMLRVLRECTHMHIESLTIEKIEELQHEKVAIVAPREDINKFLVDFYFPDHSIELHNVFLRIHKENIGEEDIPKGEKIPLTTFEKEIFSKVISEAEKSADWWRQVGAALVKDGELIAIAHNEHMPEEELPNIIGDARSLFKKGVHINYVTAAHAEVGVIGEAARKGVATEGAQLFVTDFPCPYCARLIAKGGIKKVYYMKGYAVLGGDDFMRDMGIETVKIEVA